MNTIRTESTTFSFHLFGDLSLDDPQRSLSETELSELYRYLPLIQDLDNSWKRRSETRWNLNSAFTRLVERETATWRQLGVDRSPQYILPPSGSMCSPLACHLFNPTFYVADPENRVTDDPTNPTMKLIHASGFSSDICLVFDQVCRRVETLDVLWFYSEVIYKPHRDFICELRQNMSAIVEICWGRDVWKEVERELGSRLIRFPLWGIFKPVRLYLELEEDFRSLKRFILHVYHPQFFVKSGLAKLGPEARKKFGEAQDLALTVAARLIRNGTKSNINYFQTDQPPRERCRITRQQEYLKHKNVEHVRKTLQAIFPQKYQQREAQQACRNKELQEIESLRQSLTQTSLKPMVTDSRAEISQNRLESLYRDRYDKLIEIIASFEKFHQDILLDDTFRSPSTDMNSLENIEREFFTWEALPKQFTDWLQTQEGLRINGEPIANRDMLETTFQLLHYRSSSISAFFDSTNSPIIELAVKVPTGYIKEITSTRNPFIRNNTIPGSLEQVIRRRCSACKMSTLDDAFPLFSKDMPDRYVIKINFKGDGCGRPGCKGNPSIIPIDARQKHVAPIKKGFDKALRTEERVIKLSILLRSGSDLKSCSSTVLVKCPKCNRTREYHARWTIHDPPRFLQPYLSCNTCGNSNGYFHAVDTQIPTVTEASLYSVLKRFREVGCNLMNFPKLPGVIFARTSYKERFEMLKQAKDKLYDLETTRKRKRDTS